MSCKVEKVKCKVKTLTPVHVGSGDRYLAVDFVIVKDKVVFIDPLKFFEEINSNHDLVDVAREIADGRSIGDFVKDISKLKTGEVPFIGKKKRNEILEHVKCCGNLFIPGSTIKGAIRTALLWKAVKDNRSLLDWTIKHIKNVAGKRRYIKRDELKRLDDALESKVFRKSSKDPKNDILRALKVTDSTQFHRRVVYEIKFLGMGNFSQLVECIDFDDSAEIEMQIDRCTQEFMDLEFMGQRKDLDLDTIREAAKEFAEEIVKTETKRNYPEKTKEEFRKVLKAKGIVLRIGWGIGWYSTTIGTLLKTHPEFESLRIKLGLGRNPRSNRFSRNFPVVRRVTCDGKPLGWVVIHDCHD